MRRIAVISSVFSGYDPINTPKPQCADAEWKLVTDVPQDAPGWDVIVEPRAVSGRLAAKVAKCCPHFYADADIYIWLDGSFDVTSSFLVTYAIEHLRDADVAITRHPWRKSIVAEAEASMAMPKYKGLPCVEQAEHYVAGGFPDGWGLWECGFMVQTRAYAEAIGPLWLAEQVRWTIQDQISLPSLLRRHKAVVADLPDPLREHPHLKLRYHPREES